MRRSIVIILSFGTVIAGYSAYASMKLKTDERINKVAKDQEEENMEHHKDHNEHAGHGEME